MKLKKKLALKFSEGQCEEFDAFIAGWEKALERASKYLKDYDTSDWNPRYRDVYADRIGDIKKLGEEEADET